MATNFEIKQDSFCRFTRLRQTHKTAAFMDILMDVYEKSLETPTDAPVITEGDTIEEAPVAVTEPTEAPVVEKAPVKRTRTVKKDTK